MTAAGFTTTTVRPIGKCESCGFDVYEYMAHFCPTNSAPVNSVCAPEDTDLASELLGALKGLVHAYEITDTGSYERAALQAIAHAEAKGVSMTARPFDLKAALSGEPVVSTGGLRSLKYVFDKTVLIDGKTALKFVAAPDEPHGCEFNATLDGKSAFFPNDPYQLVMAPRKTRKTVWVNLYRTDKSHWSGVFSQWKTEHDAKQCSSSENAVAIAVPVEIEVAE